MKDKLHIIIAIIILILLIPISINSYYSTPLKLMINNQEYIIYQDTEEINLLSYNTSDELLITKKTINFNTKINHQKIKYNHMASFGHQLIQKDNSLNIEINYITGKKRNIKLNIYPSTLEQIQTEGSSIYVGNYYTSTVKDRTIFNYQIIINEKGNITYYRQTPIPTYNFQKHENTYTYIEDQNLIITDEYFNIIKKISNVEKYIYYDKNSYVIYANNKLQYIQDNETIWELDEQIDNLIEDIDHHLLITNNEKNTIKKINKENSKNIWQISNSKGTFKLTKKQQIKNLKSIIPMDTNTYIVLTDNKKIIIKLNPTKKKITSFKSVSTNLESISMYNLENQKYLKITKEENTTIIEDNNLKIEIPIPISTIEKK